jgi:hypothetical protein
MGNRIVDSLDVHDEQAWRTPVLQVRDGLVDATVPDLG